MPIKELIPAIKGVEVPQDVLKIATELPYRDFITVGLLVKKLKIENQTKIKTYKDRIPDTWIYIQERDVKIGRLGFLIIGLLIWWMIIKIQCGLV